MDDYLDNEPEHASPADSEAFWALATLLLCLAMAVTATLGTQVLTGAHRWTMWQVLSPVLAVPPVIVTAAIVHAYLPRRHHG